MRADTDCTVLDYRRHNSRKIILRRTELQFEWPLIIGFYAGVQSVSDYGFCVPSVVH